MRKLRETFDELGSSGISEDPLSIVGDFVALGAPARREGQTAPTKAPKRLPVVSQALQQQKPKVLKLGRESGAREKEAREKARKREESRRTSPK